MSVTLKIYSATWCGPCQMLKKTLSSNDLGIQTNILDVDESSDQATVDKVRAVPTLILLENGVEVKRTSGAKTLDQLKEFIKT